jgi:cell division protein FtsZ
MEYEMLLTEDTVKQDGGTTRRKFLTIASGLCFGAFLPIPVLGYCKNEILNTKDQIYDAEKLPFGYTENEDQGLANIKVVGIGEAGLKIVDQILDADLEGVGFIAINNDAEALGNSKAFIRLLTGDGLLQGQAACSDPKSYGQSVFDDPGTVIKALRGSDIVFVIAGLGETEREAVQVMASTCKVLGAVTIALVAMPFSTEGEDRIRQAEEELGVLMETADVVIQVPSEKTRAPISTKPLLMEVFQSADRMLTESADSISNLIAMVQSLDLDVEAVPEVLSKALMPNAGIEKGTWTTAGTAMRRYYEYRKECAIVDARMILNWLTGEVRLTIVNQTLKEAGLA